MDVILNKRITFESSHRLGVAGWSDEENRRFFGDEAGGKHGHGHNFVGWFGFSGPVDNNSGMIAELGDVKARINTLIDSRYDHKFLNVDTLPFHRLNPTPENLAKQLLDEASTLFTDEPAKLMRVHLMDSPDSAATAFSNKIVQKHFTGRFSAARTTSSPHLSPEENAAIFGSAASPHGHGHNYRAIVTLEGTPDPKHGLIFSEVETWRALNDIMERWNHKNLNKEVTELQNIPITTECLARVIFHELSDQMPVKKVRLYEKDDFFAEFHKGGRFTMGIKSSFNAAHRLHVKSFSNDQNMKLYGKCNNPQGHGHRYDVECVVTGQLDETSGALQCLEEMQRELDTSLARWNYKHLDLETDDFIERPSTGENIVQVLWDRLSDAMAAELWGLRLWETESNLFEIQKEL
ncbi:MAG: 6-carboxytetrahydropterin synthase [Candidatus Zixiibacteriota bacterium]